MRDQALRYIREQALLHAGDRAAVAVSGGADSVALLRLLLEVRAELGIVLAVAHFNHGLRSHDSDADEAFVRDLAQQHGLEFLGGHAKVREHALAGKLSLEAAGRELRYRWFAQIAAEQRLNAIATGHTLDDQAETVLLKFLRGAGTRGLAGIWPSLELPTKGCNSAEVELLSQHHISAEQESGSPMQELRRSGGAVSPGREPWVGRKNETESRRDGITDAPRIVRPLLCASREEVETYLTALGQSWREDASNLERRFLRNRVRHELLPLLEREYNPNIRQALSDLADIAREEEEYWRSEVARELDQRSRPPGPKPKGKTRADAGLGETEPHKISIEGLARLSVALQRRLLKRFAEDHGIALDFEHIEKLRLCASGELPKTELPGGWLALRRNQYLQLCPPSSDAAAPVDYQLALSIPGDVHIPQLGLTLRAQIVREAFARELPPEELLAADLLGGELVVRNWRPGDRFLPTHSRNQEKLKRLFADKRIAEEQRAGWPVALCGSEIVWVRGFPVAKTYRWRGKGDAARITAITV